MKYVLKTDIMASNAEKKFIKPTSLVEYSELTRLEKIPTDIFEKIEEGVNFIVDEIIKLIQTRQKENKYCVLGLGTGTSLSPIYAELVRRHKKEGVSFVNVIIFNAYDYYPLKENDYHSSLNKLHTLLLDKVDVDKKNIYSPDGNVAQGDIDQSLRSYEQKIKNFGGIDIMLLGIGRGGNIAANEPGSTLTSTSRLILIDGLTREEMTNSFSSTEPVPPCSLTMGVTTILSAKKIYIAAWGEEKAEVIYKMVEGEITSNIPASFLQTHNDAHVVIDLSAASKLTRIVHPWLVTSCSWTDKLTKSALVWLCRKINKPILKLTNKDYNENGLSELLAIYGSAYDANIKVFNDLQHTITGWPGGKPNSDDSARPERSNPYPKRVLVFSPHPDDDVISMGGTIQRLVKHGHIVHIAYQTSGNIAVNDEEVVRFMHFINGFNQLFNNSEDKIIEDKYKEIKQFLINKKPTDLDNKDVLTIKGLIRRGEARTACTFNKIPLSRVHFLDLPFYESGKVEKLPITDKDIDIVYDLLNEIKPHQIFIAGDLSDPHGTHKKCTDIIITALDRMKKENQEWLKHCRVWMYRGAWAEWEIEDIEMCVPMSPEELLEKRKAILKHQSQMESAPFLGNDERLFWQRAEDRNRDTALVYHQLGLPCYEAMEAFVQYKVI